MRLMGETRLVIEKAGCGLCCKAEDHIALAELVREFTLKTEDHNIMGENARNYYKKHFDKTLFINNLIKLIKFDNNGNNC